jgi:hypothetical protein
VRLFFLQTLAQLGCEYSGAAGWASPVVALTIQAGAWGVAKIRDRRNPPNGDDDDDEAES